MSVEIGHSYTAGRQSFLRLLIGGLCIISTGNTCAFAQIASPDDIVNQIPPQISTPAAQFSVFERLALLELDIFGMNDPKPPPVERLESLEKSVLGANFDCGPGSLIERINKLMFELRPSDALVEHLVREKNSEPEWSSKKARSPWLNTSLQRVATLEKAICGEIKSGFLVERIHDLEKEVWPDKTSPTDASLSDQIEILWELIKPTPELALETEKDLRKKGVMANASASPFGSLGNGMKSVGRSVKGAAQPIRGVLKSPTFWMAVVGAAAVVGLVFAMRSAEANQQVPPYGFTNHMCTGQPNCRHCKNCHDCVWCNSNASPKCGVYFRAAR